MASFMKMLGDKNKTSVTFLIEMLKHFYYNETDVHNISLGL